MKYRDFGKTGIKVSEVGFGAWAIGGNQHGNSYGPVEDDQSIAALERAFELGCNFIDTADAYGFGHSERLIGRAIRGRRDEVVLATKVGSDFYQGFGFQTFTEEYLQFAFQKSLERLSTDYLDVYQLHNPPLDVIKNEETYRPLLDMKKAGKIRSWGLSVTTSKEALAALETANPDSLQLPYNLFGSELKELVFSKAKSTGCAILVREPLANGFLTGKYGPDSKFEKGDVRKGWPRDYIRARVQAAEKLRFLELPGKRSLAQSAISWVLDSAEVSVVIAGIKTDLQAQENLTAGDTPALKPTELAQIKELQQEKFGLKA